MSSRQFVKRVQQPIPPDSPSLQRQLYGTTRAKVRDQAIIPTPRELEIRAEKARFKQWLKKYVNGGV